MSYTSVGCISSRQLEFCVPTEGRQSCQTATNRQDQMLSAPCEVLPDVQKFAKIRALPQPWSLKDVAICRHTLSASVGGKTGESGAFPRCQDEGHQCAKNTCRMGNMLYLVVALLRLGLSVSRLSAWVSTGTSSLLSPTEVELFRVMKLLAPSTAVRAGSMRCLDPTDA